VARYKRAADNLGAFLCFEDETGQNLTPGKVRTWSRRGRTPVMAVSHGGTGRVSVAGMLCVKPGERPRLIYRTHTYHRRKGETKGLTEADYAALLTAAHQQLHAPMVLIWDNINTHGTPTMHAFLNAHTDWLTVYHLPPYAPELNPAEGIWANLKGGLGNFAVHGIDALTAMVKTRLKRMQYRPDLITGFFNETGLTLELQPR
jgi:putative transposase